MSASRRTMIIRQSSRGVAGNSRRLMPLSVESADLRYSLALVGLAADQQGREITSPPAASGVQHMSARSTLVRASRIALVLSLSLLAIVPTANAASVTSATYEVYQLHGAEVWFTPTTGTFVGYGEGT